MKSLENISDETPLTREVFVDLMKTFAKRHPEVQGFHEANSVDPETTVDYVGTLRDSHRFLIKYHEGVNEGEFVRELTLLFNLGEIIHGSLSPEDCDQLTENMHETLPESTMLEIAIAETSDGEEFVVLMYQDLNLDENFNFAGVVDESFQELCEAIPAVEQRYFSVSQ